MSAVDAWVKLRENVVTWQEVEGEIIVLDLLHSEYIHVNAAGSLLWAALAEGSTVPELVGRLREAYGIPQPDATADVEAFLADCRGRGFLEP